jgi:polar amino acid transport system substrate-binding protein
MRHGYARLLAAVALPAALVVLSAAGASARPAKAANKQAIDRGRETFNSNCAHCHGEDAITDDPFFNLPQLLSDKSDAFFFKTVANGIDAKGMPPWKTILKRHQMEDILSFLRSVEQDQGLTDSGAPGQ